MSYAAVMAEMLFQSHAGIDGEHNIRSPGGKKLFRQQKMEKILLLLLIVMELYY